MQGLEKPNEMQRTVVRLSAKTCRLDKVVRASKVALRAHSVPPGVLCAVKTVSLPTDCILVSRADMLLEMSFCEAGTIAIVGGDVSYVLLLEHGPTWRPATLQNTEVLSKTSRSVSRYKSPAPSI